MVAFTCAFLAVGASSRETVWFKMVVAVGRVVMDFIGIEETDEIVGG
jgi:uncharacterized membrane protein (DUF485 family)